MYQHKKYDKSINCLKITKRIFNVKNLFNYELGVFKYKLARFFYK